MRISDWSSDVCSSDLGKAGLRHLEGNAVVFRQVGLAAQEDGAAAAELHHLALDEHHPVGGVAHIGSIGAVVLQEHLAAHRLDRRMPPRGVGAVDDQIAAVLARSDEHTSELQSLMRISYA